MGIKNRETGQVKAQVVERADVRTALSFVEGNTDEGGTGYTGGSPIYNDLWREHESVKHSDGEYVRDYAHTQDIDSFWSMLKRARTGTYHQMSAKHLHRYAKEFTGDTTLVNRTRLNKWLRWLQQVNASDRGIKI